MKITNRALIYRFFLNPAYYDNEVEFPPLVKTNYEGKHYISAKDCAKVKIVLDYDGFYVPAVITKDNRLFYVTL